MQEAHVLIFGTAKAGTPLMIASPLLALDLPLKVLIWEDGEGRIWVSCNNPEYLGQRHNIPGALLKNIAGIGPLLQKVVG